jgi:hypothetical protein
LTIPTQGPIAMPLGKIEKEFNKAQDRLLNGGDDSE